MASKITKGIIISGWVLYVAALGAVVALACNALCVLPGERGVIPLNAVTPLIGAPVVIYVITRRRR